MSHSALSDYYCYYCHTRKLYCEWCRPQPLQAYYALYYAGYYSSYYSHYFARFAEDAAQQRARKQRPFALQRIADLPSQLVLDVSDDQGY